MSEDREPEFWKTQCNDGSDHKTDTTDKHLTEADGQRRGHGQGRQGTPSETP